MTEPTEGEAANGWTEETLTAYLAQRTAEVRDYVLSGRQAKDARPPRAQSEYNPHEW